MTTAMARELPTWLKGRAVPDIRTELPGPLASKIYERDNAVTSQSLPRAYPFVPQRGYGSVIEDADGNLFLDFNAGIAVNSTGHAHPVVVAAVQRQAEELLHYSASDFILPIYSQMCEALAETAPIDGPVRVFLTNSGTEAVEGALKLARHATGRQYVISFFGSFHGRTYGAVSLTASKAKYHAGFGPLLPGVIHAPYAQRERHPVTGERDQGADHTFDYLEHTVFRYQVPPSEVAAIFVEPIQGEGGYIVPPVEWMRRLRELCHQHGILLVADEVQSGVGRSGKLWAIEHTGVRPDILISAKGLASGLPLGAFMAQAELMEHWSPGAHGSTYGGSPVPCAAGLATLEVIQSERLLDNATRQGELLLAGLRKLQQRFGDLLVDVRGIGLMIGTEYATPEIAASVQQQAFRRGLLMLDCGEKSIRISPPLVITEEETRTGLNLLGEALRAVKG
ncbi:acetyl ornithine aminotransferase family protein [Micromonospora globbae]|uniref:acetyl ornithine aminotransferase family protein n=1 Tax=Micromonospora globbae TaxID=1894969 RepID=UPI00341CED32